MKVCLKCETANSIDAIHCKSCGEILTPANLLNAQKALEAQTHKHQEQERKRMMYYRCAFIALTVLFVAAEVVGWRGGAPASFLLLCLIIPVLCYANLFHTEAIFRLQHMFAIKNVEEAEPSDWYLFTARFSSIAVYIGVIACIWVVTYAK